MTIFTKERLFIFFILLFSTMFNFSYAADAVPKFDCTLTDQLNTDKTAGEAKSTFTATTAMIYLICESQDVKKGQKIKTAWIADDTNNAAPAYYKIDEKSFEVDKEVGTGQVWNLDASLSKPDKGWPVGSYHVDIYVNDDLSQSIKFTVK